MAQIPQKIAVTPLLIMAAPNGARKTRQDHPNLPITIEDVANEARACFDAGAAMLHAHIRDNNGQHSLDTARYRDLLALLAETVPGMPIQITTEKAGKFSPREQAECLLQVRPDYASVAISEITGDQGGPAMDFAAGVLGDAAAAGTHLQYILYDLDNLELLRQMHAQGQLPEQPVDILFVLGRYNPDFRSHPDELDPFLARDRTFIRHWMVCAFGPMEYDIMVKVHHHGGLARIGFENNLYLKDGQIAPSTAALVAQLGADRETLTGAEAEALFR